MKVLNLEMFSSRLLPLYTFLLLSEADRKKEDEHKFRYVFKGPTKAKQKKLYYVFGKGMNAKDKGLITGIKKPQGKGYQWPDSFQKPNHLHYNIEFLKQGRI